MTKIDKAAVALFKKKAPLIAIRIAEVKNMNEAMAYALDICEKKEPRELLLPGVEPEAAASEDGLPRRASVKTLAAPGLAAASFNTLKKKGEERGFTVLRQNMRDHLSGIDVAFTTADMAIADTATCVLESLSEDLRLATMVCEVHVIALKQSQIMPDLDAVSDSLQALMEQGPMYTAFISGPSRTADIERVLTLGVHGPLELHVALMEG